MKHLPLIIIAFLSINAYGQDKYSHINFNKLTEITGTEYVIATIEDRGKIEINNKYLLFINTGTGETNQVDLPKNSYIEKIEQVKIDDLGVNKIILCAKTVNLNEKANIHWSDPKQVFILSTDGTEKIQLTEDNFFTRTWVVNQLTATIIITGHYDSNNNKRHDPKDKNAILIFDLRTNKLIKKL